jgi:nitrogen fixation NifU-like protein
MSGQELAQADRELVEFYRETILRHSVNPVGFQASIDATHQNEQYNPLCGDRIRLSFQVRGDEIEAAAFDGAACAICMASASLLCAEAGGQHIDHIKKTHEWLEHSLTSAEKTPGPENLQALLGVRSYPSRIKCALLPWVAAVKALAQ